ncbi:MAG: hypothetical protein B7X36_14435, partial [Thiomonas sp. 14-64-326]
MLQTSRSAFFRTASVIAALSTALLLAACGGGGGNTTSGATPSPTPSTSSDTAPPSNVSMAYNEVAVSIRQLGSNTTTLTANTPYVTVTVCAPGGSPCQSIPDVLVDTGSQGLRLFSAALNSTQLSALPQITNGSSTLAACAQFASGYAWGSMRQAIVQI